MDDEVMSYAGSEVSEYQYSDEEYQYPDEEGSVGSMGQSDDEEGSQSEMHNSVSSSINEKTTVEKDGKTEGQSNSGLISMDSDVCLEAHSANNISGIRMLKATDMVPIMKKKIAEVTSILEITPSAAAILLREHKWMKERLFETYYEDADRVLEKCNVKARCSSNRENIDSSKKCQSKTMVCAICTDEIDDMSQMYSMPCDHNFCVDCWKDYIEFNVKSGPTCVRATCPQAGCREAVTEEEVGRFQPLLLEKFESYQLRSFVEINGMSRWCPGPGCTRVAMVLGGSGLSVVAECDDCTTRFCMRCGGEPHQPSSCKELEKWNEKCRNESETANWILANTKPCPKCSSRIEKNQGCNHMSCQQCKHEFCWICMAPWSEHGANTGGYYKCNKFDSSAGADDQSDAARAKRELDRYLHYYKRFHAHSEAQKFAKKQLRETEARMMLLQESTSDNTTWTDVEFLKSAVEQLIECRRVLKYTYTFAYYLSDNTKQMQRERFEHHQEMLERFTETLSELSEQPFAKIDRTDVVNQTRVVDLFMKNILKYVEEGMEET